VVGLVFATGEDYSWANDFNQVLNEVNGAPPPIRIVYYPFGIYGTGNPASAEHTDTAVDCTGLTKANGTLQIKLKASNPGILTSNGWIEITSSGGADVNEWAVPAPYTEITTDWQVFEIPLAEAVTAGGELDVSAINYLRWYNYTTGGDVTIYWDQPMIFQSRPHTINF